MQQELHHHRFRQYFMMILVEFEALLGILAPHPNKRRFVTGTQWTCNFIGQLIIFTIRNFATNTIKPNKFTKLK